MEPAEEEEVALDFDPQEAMHCKSGVWTLPDSELKFKVDASGSMQMIDDEEAARVAEQHEKETTNGDTSRVEQQEIKEEEKEEQEEKRTCIQCNKTGLLKNFIRAGKFCSTACATAQANKLKSMATLLSVNGDQASKSMARSLIRRAKTGIKKKRDISGPLVQITPQSALHQSIFSLRLLQHQQEPPIGWEKHCKNLQPFLQDIKPPDVLRWTPDKVAEFVNTIPGCQDIGQKFADELIDGEAFLLLNQQDLLKVLNVKLGPAVKIYNSVILIRDAIEQ